MDDALSAPLSTTVNITDLCNFSCTYCYASTTKTGPIHMSAEVAVNVLRQLQDRNVWKIMVAGGEPFLHPDILEILESALGSGVKLALLTNGTLLNGIYEPFLSIYRRYSHLMMLQISLDGATAEVHDRTRAQGRKVLATIRRLAGDGVELQLATVVTSSNVQHVTDVVRTFYPSVRRFHVMKLMPSLGTERCSEPLGAAPGDIARLFDELECMKRSDSELKISLPWRQGTGDEGIVPEMDCPGCVAAFTRMDINPNGDVLACHMAYDSVIGNIHRNTLDEIWHSATAQHYRETALPLCRMNRLRSELGTS